MLFKEILLWETRGFLYRVLPFGIKNKDSFLQLQFIIKIQGDGDVIEVWVWINTVDNHTTDTLNFKLKQKDSF